jgi:hypothetical protein
MPTMIKPALTSDEVISALVQALAGSSGVDENTLTQALEGLVRLAQAEQLLRMQVDFERATDPLGQNSNGMARNA